MSTQSVGIKEFYSARHILSYRIELWHRDLKHRVITGNRPDDRRTEGTLQANEWNEKWAGIQHQEVQKGQKEKRKDYIEGQKVAAAERTAEAAAALASLEQLLAYTLTVNDAIDWERLKVCSDFSEPRPTPESNRTLRFL